MYRPSRIVAKTVFSAFDLFMPRLEGPRILLYHQVGTDLGREMEVSKRMFELHLDWILAGWKVTDLESALAVREKRGSTEDFVLTFDDGYADVFESAFPLLVERQLPFTIYLNTHPVESRTPLAPGAEPLTWAQISEMLSTGLVTIGAHTHRHSDLRLLDVAAIEEELASCDELIEHRLGLAPRHFAYPWGFWDEDAEQMIRERYATAALATPGSIDEHTDAHRLPRIPVQRSDGFMFLKRKARSGLRVEEWARRLVKGYEVPTMS